MSKRKGKIYIGTSGWHYKHWTGTFYPENIKGSKQFNEYLKYFDTVEINNSFYKLPAEKNFQTMVPGCSKRFFICNKSQPLYHPPKKAGCK